VVRATWEKISARVRSQDLGLFVFSPNRLLSITSGAFLRARWARYVETDALLANPFRINQGELRRERREIGPHLMLSF